MIYLASQSPQRTRLLSEHGIDHIIVRRSTAALIRSCSAGLLLLGLRSLLIHCFGQLV